MSQQYLQILVTGVRSWNKWRNENPDLSIDFSGVQFAEPGVAGNILWNSALEITDLSSVNFSGVNLENANLEGVNLSGANLIGANLRNANLWDTKFVNADLRFADITGAYLVEADLSGVNANGLIYDPSAMSGSYKGIKVGGILHNDSFRHAAIEQAYLDALKRKIPGIAFWA